MIVDANGGMLDGGLSLTPLSGPVEAAQEEFLRNLSEVEEVQWKARWREAEQPDWWEGDLCPVSR